MVPLKPSQANSSASRQPARTTGGNRPIGWPSDAAPVSAEADAQKELKGPEKRDEDERWEDRPILWDELDQIGELVDLDASRPPGMQRLVDAHKEYMMNRANNADMYADIWRQIAGARSPVDEDMGRVAGLGA